MSDQAEFDRITGAWLDAGPDRAPQTVIDTVLLAAREVPQMRPGPLAAVTRPPVALGLAAALIVVAIIAGAAFLNRPADPAGPVPSPTGGATPAATSSPSPSPSPEPTATPDPEAALIARLPAQLTRECGSSTLTAAFMAADLLRQVPAAGLPGQDPMVPNTQTVEPPIAVVACGSDAAGGAPDGIWVIDWLPRPDFHANTAIAFAQTFFELPDGDCAIAAPAYGFWPAPGLDARGRAGCRLDGNGTAWVYWQDEAEQIVYLARREDGDLDALRAWWVANRETMLGPG